MSSAIPPRNPSELPLTAPVSSERVIASEELFQGRRQVSIRHSGQDYRLQITKAGKLILNK